MGLNAVGEFSLKKNLALGKSELPGAWHPIITAQAKKARGTLMDGLSENQKDRAESQVWEGYLAKFGGAASAQLSDGDIKRQARAYALEADNLDIGQILIQGDAAEVARLKDFCGHREVLPPPDDLLIKGQGARVRCQFWWRRALRKMVARKAEAGHLAMGLVCATRHQPYCSNQTVFRRLDQNARNASAMAAITFENDAGYRRTLAELSATSVSNKSIRRGELMTRIRGCEEIADELGHAGLFCTLTTPSRFHSTKFGGGRNPKYDGSTPRDAQNWLCDQWAKARAKLARSGVNLYGFRVAEPHHDGCTHWHMLIWSDSPVWRVARVLKRYWLQQGRKVHSLEGRERGARKYRTNFKIMEGGSAAGYIAKYIAKNIDDHNIDDHHDDYTPETIGTDLLGDMEIKPCLRVEAWATTWGIRQFQPLGQPPVTVWRELRRVTEQNARLAGFNGVVHKAWLSAQKTAGVLASWSRYVNAQGGLMRGRKCKIVMRHEIREVDGQYESGLRPVPVGVALNMRGARTVWSERRLWRSVEVSPRLECASKQAQRAARTRVNNCTHLASSEDLDAIKLDRMRGQGTGETKKFVGWEANQGGNYPPIEEIEYASLANCESGPSAYAFW